MIAKSLDSDALLVTIELLNGNVLHHRHSESTYLTAAFR